MSNSNQKLQDALRIVHEFYLDKFHQLEIGALDVAHRTLSNDMRAIQTIRSIFAEQDRISLVLKNLLADIQEE